MARIAALLLIACALRAQSVDGTLTDSVSHAPIPDVIVTLLGPSRYNGTTDQIGAFHIPDVKPGKYVLNIVKAGYLLPDRQRPAFQVEADMRLSVEMDPLGTVEGRVRYFDGRPAPRAMVSLTAATLGSSRSEPADIGGHFLFEDLKPGAYVLSAVGAPNDPKPEGEIWAATWYPSTVDRASAEPIQVTIGYTASHDVRLRSVQARRIHGVVRDDVGQLAAGVSVGLHGARNDTAVTGADGAFDFLAYDGDWRLTASRKDADVELRGASPVNVSRHDVEKADVRLYRPFTVPVIVEGDEAPTRNGVRMPTMIIMVAADAPNGGLNPRVVDGGITGVYPGRYYIHAMFAATGMYLESVKLGDIDTAGEPVQIWDATQPVRITYRNRAGTVRGVVEKGEGASVLVIAADGYTRSGTARPDGSFQVGELPPGDYSVLAFAHTEPMPMIVAAMWRPLLPRAERVHVDRGATVVVALKALPIP